MPDTRSARSTARVIPVASRPFRKPEPWIVDRDAAKVVPQREDNLPVQKAPDGVAVKHDDGRSVALVDIMHARACTVEPP
jgi:hypothetical protein